MIGKDVNKIPIILACEKSRFPKIIRKSSLPASRRFCLLWDTRRSQPLESSTSHLKSRLSGHLARQLKLFELSSPHMNNAVVRLERSADLQNTRSAQQDQCAFFAGLARLHTRSD